jgi:hypothetical protein
VIVAGMSVTGRDWLLTTLRALLEAEFEEQALAGSRQSGTSMNGTDALQVRGLETGSVDGTLSTTA